MIKTKQKTKISRQTEYQSKYTKMDIIENKF